MWRIWACTLIIVVACMVSFCFAEEKPSVGGYEQYPPGPLTEEQIGAGWGHRSMTYGMMNMMSGMTSQVADILRTHKATPEMMDRLAEILYHVARMMDNAPAYMMGTKTVDSAHMQEMSEMLKDLERMREETGLK
jgi:hypothetical protein